ncbi:cobaltochelatase subunit CobN, partial [Enterococcus faecium]
RADQWQAVHDTFVRDSRQLGLAQWFEQHNASAQVQMIERLQEAISRGYWHADDRTRAELQARLQQLQASSASEPAPTQVHP